MGSFKRKPCPWLHNWHGKRLDGICSDPDAMNGVCKLFDIQREREEKAALRLSYKAMGMEFPKELESKVNNT